jgi:predicted dehydrogenase
MTALTAASLPAWFAEEAMGAELDLARSLPKRIGPGDTINIGLIGSGGPNVGFRQGFGDAKGISSKPGVKCIAVCDVDTTHREWAAKEFGPETKTYKDFRELLANKDIDAVVIGTPDHWHAIIAIAAMKAGKDVYCEKPLTLTVAEGKRIVETQKKTGRIFQTGSQQRSDARFRLATDLVRNGRLGKITKVETHLPEGPNGGPFPVIPVPEGFDWDMWQGPTPFVDYVKERTHGSFRQWLEYSGGMMTDWGAHHNDIMQWGLGMDAAGPLWVDGKGTPADPAGPTCYNAFPKFEVHYGYPENIEVICTSGGENGVLFVGERGEIFVSRGIIRSNDQALLDEPLPDDAKRGYISNDHHMNFVDGVRNRKACICDAPIGHRSVTVCHIGNLSMRLGRKLEWDAKKEEFKKDKDANKMLDRQHRKEYT